MKTIGIIGAMEEEILMFKEKSEVVTVKNVVGLNFYVARYLGTGIVFVKSGIGKVNAAICTQAMIDLFAVDYIIMVGVAGALNSDLKIGDIVVSKDTALHDMDATAFGYSIGEIPGMGESFFKADDELIKKVYEAYEELKPPSKLVLGRIVSGDKFISSAQEKAKICSDVGGYCVEMEGAAVAQACFLNRIPFVIIRSISDEANNNATESFEEFCSLAAKRSSDLVLKMIEKL